MGGGSGEEKEDAAGDIIARVLLDVIKCFRYKNPILLRNAMYLLDNDVYSFPAGRHKHTACCASEPKICLDNLGSVICYNAWLLCVVGDAQ